MNIKHGSDLYLKEVNLKILNPYSAIKQKEPPSFILSKKTIGWFSIRTILIIKAFWILFDVLYYFLPSTIQSLYYYAIQLQWGLPDLIFEYFIYDRLPAALQDIIYYCFYLPYNLLEAIISIIIPFDTLLISSALKFTIIACIYDYGIYRVLPGSIKKAINTISYFPYILFKHLFTKGILPILPVWIKRMYFKFESIQSQLM
jgi:hypothetical protein